MADRSDVGVLAARRISLAVGLRLRPVSHAADAVAREVSALFRRLGAVHRNSNHADSGGTRTRARPGVGNVSPIRPHRRGAARSGGGVLAARPSVLAFDSVLAAIANTAHTEITREIAALRHDLRAVQRARTSSTRALPVLEWRFAVRANGSRHRAISFCVSVLLARRNHACGLDKRGAERFCFAGARKATPAGAVALAHAVALAMHPTHLFAAIAIRWSRSRELPARWHVHIGALRSLNASSGSAFAR